MSEIDILKRRLAREIAARKQAEQILENKAIELHKANERLRTLNYSLEDTVATRTKELELSKQRFQSLVESAGDIIFNIDPEGRFTYINPVTERILGRKIDHLLGKHFTDLIPEHDRQRVYDFYLTQLAEKQKTSYLEFPVIHADGSQIWLGQRVDITYDEDTPKSITAIARDISQLIEASKELEASEEKYRGIIEGMQLGMLEIDDKGLITKAYPHFCEMTGYDENELLGKDPIHLLAHPDDIEILKEQEENRNKGKAGNYEIRLKNKAGEYLWVVISGAPYYNTKGEKIGSAGIHLDITYQKKLQQELKKAKDEADNARQAEKQFLAKMSHELRTPLNAITGITYLLATTGLSKTQKEYLNDIQYASELLLGMVSDVLDLSKIEAGELEPNIGECNIRDSVGMLVKTLEYRANNAENEIFSHIDESVPELIITDKNILNQILLNLVGNAIKFTKNGTIGVVVKSISATGGNNIIEFSVIDTGIGIQSDKLKHIFKKYRQETTSTAQQHGGTGLGLAICKELVKILGGEITVQSKPGEGSTFKFTINTEVGHKDQRQTKFARSTSNKSAQHLRTVLVAEDSFLNRKYILGLLNQWRIKFDIAKDGQEAIMLSETKPYAIVLMDMQMPLKNGYEAVAEIRNNPDNPNNQTPIVALTASALLEEVRLAEEAGVDLHVTKPFTPDNLHNLFSQITPQLLGNKITSEKELEPFSQLKLPKGLSAESLSKLYGNDLEHAEHIVSIFVETIADSMAEANTALSSKDQRGVATWLHKVKPSFAMIGNIGLTQKFADMEEEVKQGNDLEMLIPKIEYLILEANKMEAVAKELRVQLKNFSYDNSGNS